MDLSIIIPSHNLENYIDKCIDSILCQDIQQYECEIIFICDSCTDKTKEIITDRMKTETNFQWSLWICEYHNPGETRNVGLENCSGDYIWFIDGDDWLIDDNAIQKGLKILKERPDLDYIMFEFDSQGFKWRYIDVMVWRYIFKYEAIANLRFVRTTPTEDDDFIDQVKKSKIKGFFIYEKWYWYNYPREDSIMFNSRKTNGNKSNHGRPPWKK